MIRHEYVFPFGFRRIVDPLIGVETESGVLLRRLINSPYLYLCRSRWNIEVLVDIRYMYFYTEDDDLIPFRDYVNIYLSDFLREEGLPLNVYGV